MTAVAADRSGRAERGPLIDVDVAVVGGGLAGMAAATHLARAGRRVVCVEERSWPRCAVGESLEFSAPRLLADLGIGPDHRGGRPHLYPKTSVRIVGGDEDFTVWPPRWFAAPPMRCARRTFHTDRVELDQQVMRLALEHGTEILPERVTIVDHDHDLVTELTTNRGTRLRARWFIDATGHTCRLLGRALSLERQLLGEPRAAFWMRLPEAPEGHATNLHFPRPTEPDLGWAWEIPLNDGEISVGVVLAAARCRTLRREGLAPQEIVARQVAAVPRLQEVIRRHPDAGLAATTYTPYRHLRPAGPNWLLVGDASAMVDPLTSNGVTSALRHAEAAARTVGETAGRPPARRRDRWAYRHTAPAAVATLDHAIETFLYRPAVRRRLGLRQAVTLYAATGVITNALYARLRAATVWRSLVCAAMLAAARAWIHLAGVALGGPAALRRNRPAPSVDSGSARSRAARRPPAAPEEADASGGPTASRSPHPASTAVRGPR